MSNNLVVYVSPDPNGGNGCYSLDPSVYTNKNYMMNKDQASQALIELSGGTVVANMPDDGDGDGVYCYLLNIPALQPPPVNPNPTLSPMQILKGVQAALYINGYTNPKIKRTVPPAEQEIFEQLQILVQQLPPPGKPFKKKNV